MQAQSSDPPPAPATKLARALRKPSGAIAVALEFARPGDLGPGLAVRARDSKERLQIAGSRGLSATVRKCAAAALLVSADAGDGYAAEALVAFAQEQVPANLHLLSRRRLTCIACKTAFFPPPSSSNLAGAGAGGFPDCRARWRGRLQSLRPLRIGRAGADWGIAGAPHAHAHAH